MNSAHFRNHIVELRDVLEESESILTEVMYQVLLVNDPASKNDYLAKIEYVVGQIREALKKGETP